MSAPSHRIESGCVGAVSVVLPVHNAHHNLERSVAELLDVLAEMSDHFELCVLDDGSTDDTAEVARELANRYPQISVVRHPVRLGLTEAIQTGLDNTQGEFVLFAHDGYSPDPDDLHTLWQLRDTERRLAAPTSSRSSIYERWIEKLRVWNPRQSGSRMPCGFQLIRRATFERLRLEQTVEMVARIDHGSRTAASVGSLRPNFLGRIKRFTWRE